VAGLENIRHPTALARLVMEKTPHLFLVGEGARWFALQQGFPLETLTTPESLAEWARRQPELGAPLAANETAGGGEPPFSHDTVTVLALDRTGNLAGACSTSGLAHKLPGRVGDSPIIGAGLYVDNTAGAAGGTGTSTRGDPAGADGGGAPPGKIPFGSSGAGVCALATRASATSIGTAHAAAARFSIRIAAGRA